MRKKDDEADEDQLPKKRPEDKLISVIAKKDLKTATRQVRHFIEDSVMIEDAKLNRVILGTDKNKVKKIYDER